MEISQDNPKYTIVENDAPATNIIEILVYTKLAKSKREAREFIKNGAIRLNDTIIEDCDYNLSMDDFLHEKFCFVRKGKHDIFALTLNSPTL